MASVIMKPYERRRDTGPVGKALLWALLILVASIYGLMVVVLPVEMMSYPASPIFILIGLILWMMPDTGGMRLDSMQAVIFPYVFLFIAWPNYVAFNLPGLPWISFTRLALFITVTIFVWNYSTSNEMRSKVASSVSGMPLAIRVFWMYWGATTVSILFSKAMGGSISKHVNNQIYWTIPLLITAVLATRQGFVYKLAQVITAATALVISYSVYEYYIQRVPWLDYIPSFLKIDPSLLQTLADTSGRAGTNVYRVRGPYAVALYFSEFLTMAFPFFLHFAYSEKNFLRATLATLGALGCFVVMIGTDARSAMVGFIIAFVLYIFYAAIRQRIRSPRSITATGVILSYPATLVMLSLVVWFWNRAHVMVLGGGQHQASSDARAEQWAMAWPKIATHPLGYGVVQGNEALGFTNPAGKGTVDSYYITVMMDSGLLALPLFLLVFLIPAWYAFVYYRTSDTAEEELFAPLSIALINFCVVKSVLSSEASIPLAYIFVGCIFGLVWQQKNKSTAVRSVDDSVESKGSGSGGARLKFSLPLYSGNYSKPKIATQNGSALVGYRSDERL